MNLKQKYWALSLLVGLVLWLGLSAPSYATETTDLTDAKVLHILNRLSFGPRPGDIETVKSQGIEAYIQSQLKPDSIAQPQSLTQQLASLEILRMSPVELMGEYQQIQMQRRMQKEGQQPNSQMLREARQQVRDRVRHVQQQAAQGRLLRAIASNHQLEEVMTDFWYNHFNVFQGKGLDRFLVASYEEQAIRPNVLGKFRTLLEATAKHPAMLFFLDNWQNTAPNSPGAKGRYKGINENYARELMELHTLGVNGGYTQQDVISLAHILTGWGFARRSKTAVGNTDPSGFYFDANRHDSSDKVFLGQTIKGGGIEEGEKALDILARHPATARHISYQLAQYFVADEPPQSLIDKLTKRFQETDGDIRAVLGTLFQSSEFLDPKYYNAKFKTPYQYVVSAIRATGTDVQDFRSVYGLLNQMGMPVYGCSTPDGYKNTESAWLNPDAIIRRINFSSALAGGRILGGKPVDTQQLSQTLGNNFSPQTKAVLTSGTEKQMQTALMLGSPEFMRH
jgi:uncharacterized protein (DUF1800 family)